MTHNYDVICSMYRKVCINAKFFWSGLTNPTLAFWGRLASCSHYQSLKLWQFEPPRISHCSIRLFFILGFQTDNHREKTFVQQEIQRYHEIPKLSPSCAKCSTQTHINRIHCCIIFLCGKCRRVALASSFFSTVSLVHLRKNLAAVNRTTMTVCQDPGGPASSFEGQLKCVQCGDPK